MKNENLKTKPLSSDDYLQKSLYDRYQRILRHPAYRCFCDTYKDFFMGKRVEESIGLYLNKIEYGHSDNRFFWKTYEDLSVEENKKESINLLLNEIKKRHRGECYWWDIYEEFSREEREEENIRFYLGEIKKYLECHQELLTIIEKFNLSSTIIHYRYALQLTEKDMVALPLFKNPLAVQFQWIDDLTDRNKHAITLVHDQHYISAKVNISLEVPFHQICAEIKSAIESARSTTGEYTEKKRDRFEDNLIAYQAFDLREQGLSYDKIKENLELESRQSAQNKVRKAHELIGIKPPSDEDLASQGRWDEIAPGKGQREQTYDDVNKITNRAGNFPTGDIHKGRNKKKVDERVYAAISDGVHSLCIECPNDVCKETKLPLIKEINFHQNQIFCCDKLKKHIRSILTK